MTLEHHIIVSIFWSVIDMLPFKLVLLSFLIAAASCSEDLDFPPGFMFGAASASYQVEGGWNASDKGESIWDRFVHEQPHFIADGSTGDVACDSYHLWRRDIEMTSELGLNFYRMSIAWPRLLPDGFANKISEDGLNYYNNLFDGLLEKGVQPMVTLYHWELPQRLQELGGWTNPLIVDWFGDYARVVYTHFADRVRLWITINEPLAFCDGPYRSGTSAPGVYSPDVGTYLCNKHALLAHAKAYRIFDEEFRPKYDGEISLANHIVWYEAMSPEDEDLAEVAREFAVGRYSHAIYSKEGGWPAVIEDILAENSKAKGYSKSFLPEFTKEEIEFIRGTFDYYAVNHYTSRLVRKPMEGEVLTASDGPDINAKYELHPDWKPTTSAWFYVNPPGLRNLLLWLKNAYGDMKFIITENGYSSSTGLEDMERVEYYREYLKQILLSIKEDDVNVVGYTAWTLMDNFEWMDGYNSRFGLYEVDFDSPKRTRTPKASAEFYKNIIKRHSLNF